MEDTSTFFKLFDLLIIFIANNMTKQETIESIVTTGLCTGCGTCVAICPQNAISMQEGSLTGHLFAEIDTERCNHCGLCYRICPGFQLESTLIDNTIDPFKGKVLAAFCGYATDSKIRLAGQSGGIVTALLGYQLHSGRIKKALVTRMPGDGSLRPRAELCSTPSEVYQARSSKYCPVAVNAALPENLKENNIAIVGLSCHLHGIRNVQAHRKDWREHISLTIGLFCDCVFTFKALDYLIQRGGLEKKAVLSLRYKDKRHGRFPGNVIIQQTDHTTVEVASSYRLKCKRLFKPARCYLCFDKVNILSDIAVGDAWGTHKSKEEGLSVVLARTQKGLDTLYAAQKDGILHLEPIDVDSVFRGQRIESRRKVWKAYTEIWKQAHRKSPEFHILQKHQGVLEETGKMYKMIREDYEWTSHLASQKTSQNVERAIKKRQQQLFFRTLFSRHGVKEILLFPVRVLKCAISKFL